MTEIQVIRSLKIIAYSRYLAILIGIISVCFLFIKSASWVDENITTWVNLLTILICVPALIVGGILSLINRSRLLSIICFHLAHCLLGLCVWLWSLTTAYRFAGVIWMIIGTFFFGVGVVAVAIVSALLRGEIPIAIFIGVFTVITYALRSHFTRLTKKLDQEIEAQNESAQTSYPAGTFYMNEEGELIEKDSLS